MKKINGIVSIGDQLEEKVFQKCITDILWHQTRLFSLDMRIWHDITLKLK